MGVEFLQRVGKRIRIARDRDLSCLAEADLFTRRLEEPTMFELLRLKHGKDIRPSDVVQIELNAEAVVAVVGEAIIGVIDDPSGSLIELLQQHGVVGGRVDTVHEGARVADVEITY